MKSHNKQTYTKPLVLLFPWLGAKKESISKYSKIYEDLSFNVIVKEVSSLDFLWPNNAFRNCQSFLQDINEYLKLHKCPLIIHSMSVGCYFYAVMLLVMHKNKEQFALVQRSIIGQVLDSPVAGHLQEMATGVANTKVDNKIAQQLLKYVTLLYFGFTKSCTVWLYYKVLDNFFYNLPCVPSLVLSSIGDPLVSPQMFEGIMSRWESLGIPLVVKVWTNSLHVHHLKFHPSAYCDLVHKLIEDSTKNSTLVNSKL